MIIVLLLLLLLLSCVQGMMYMPGSSPSGPRGPFVPQMVMLQPGMPPPGE
jgi:hypothetical protein